MRLRLLIPAAIAAIATYTALVREERRATPRRPDAGPPAPPPPPPAPVATPVAPPPATPPPVAPLAPEIAWDPARPSMYDVLAGDPAPQAARPSPGAAPPPDRAEERPAGGADARPVPPAVPMTPTEPHGATSPRIPEPAAALRPPPVHEDAPRPLWQPFPGEPAAPAPNPVHPIPPPAPPAAATPVAPVQVVDQGRFALGGWAASTGHGMVSAVTFRRRLPVDVTPAQIALEVDAAENIPDNGLMILADPGFAPDRDGFTLLLIAADPGPFSAAGTYRVYPPGT